MSTLAVIKDLNVFEDTAFSVFSGLIVTMMHMLRLQGMKEALHGGVTLKVL